MLPLRPAGPASERSDDRVRPSRRRFLLFLACSFLLTGSWALATPPWAAPDEPAHVFRAVDVVRGDILPAQRVSTRPDGGVPVKVPAGLVESAGRASCFAFHSDVPASCAGDTGPDSRLVDTYNPAARYHPVYYALVGWPSFFLSDNKAVFAMRLVSAFLVSVLIALGLQSAAEHPRSRLLLTGSFLALTPMVIFLGGTVQPSAVEIAGGFAVWTSGLALLASDDPDHQRTLLRRLGIGASLMVVTRSISPLWLGLTLLAFLLLAGRHRLLELVRLRSMRIWAPVVAAATLASGLWTVVAKPNPLPVERSDPATLQAAVRTVMEIMPVRLDQYIGRFGWLDTPSPTYSLVVLTVLIGFAAVIGLTLGTRRQLLVLAGLVLTVFALPVALEASTFNTAGYFWQMRYTLPLAVGVPLLGLSVVTAESGAAFRRLLESRLTWLVVLLGAPAQLLCFVWALRRYQVGTQVPLGVLDGSWAPRVGTWTVIALQVVGLVLWGVLTVRWTRVREALPADDTRPLRPREELALASG